MVSDKVLRHTSASPTASSGQAAEQAFWSMALQYYYHYYRGDFTPYMGKQLAAPSLASGSTTSTAYTASDIEIQQAVSVFVEFLLDNIFQSPIWKVPAAGGKTYTYYPSGSTTAPTALTLQNLTSLGTLSSGLTGCGMNVPKANFVRYLANAFSDAAGADTSLTIKTAGGIDIGFGILGKVSIGDNKTLTDLVQMAVTEVVSRLTVAFAVPIVSAIDLGQQKQPPAAAMQVSNTATSKSSGSYSTVALSALFVSAKAQ